MGKYLKKFTTGQEHDAYLDGAYLNPNISYIVNQKVTTYNNNPLFPINITLTKKENQDVYADASQSVKRLYDYYMENCVLDSNKLFGETHLYLTDKQELYIDGIKVTKLFQDSNNITQKSVQWYPDNVWSTNVWYAAGGLRADGSILIHYDD